MDSLTRETVYGTPFGTTTPSFISKFPTKEGGPLLISLDFTIPQKKFNIPF